MKPSYQTFCLLSFCYWSDCIPKWLKIASEWLSENCHQKMLEACEEAMKCAKLSAERLRMWQAETFSPHECYLTQAG